MNFDNDSEIMFVTQIPIQKRILIIDDEEDITVSLRTVLEEYGFKTDSYTDPVLAHKNFKNGQYDLVILDIKMPVFDGFALYQKMKKMDSNIQCTCPGGCQNMLLNIFVKKLEKSMDLMNSIKYYF